MAFNVYKDYATNRCVVAEEAASPDGMMWRQVAGPFETQESAQRFAEECNAKSPSILDQLKTPEYRAMTVAYSFMRIGGAGLGAYHGYKRHRGSVWAAIGWGILGTTFPVITSGVALAQGVGKPKPRS